MLKITLGRMVVMAAWVAGTLTIGSAVAQTQPVPTDEDVDRAFQAVLADPTNLDKTFRYAGLAAAHGDFEAAISSLERMLIFNPGLPRVKVELGVLYFRLRSFAAARSYFDQALAAPDMPEAARERVNRYIAQIEEAEATHNFAFSFSAGLRFQTNANSAPDGNVLVVDIPATLDPEFQEQEDFDVFFSGRMRHYYNFGGQNGDLLETNASVFASHQFEVDNLDVYYLGVDTGPVLHILPSRGLTARPYLSGSYLMLSDDPYQASIGGGVTLGMPMSDQVHVSLDGSLRAARYSNSDIRPNADELDGTEATIKGTVNFQPTTYLRISGHAHYRYVDTEADFQTFGEVSAGIITSLEVPAPVNLTKGASNWSLSLDLRGMQRNYDAANTIVSQEKRDEQEVRIDAQVYVPVSSNFGVFTGLEWREVSSNIPNYDVENFTVMGGVSGRF